MDREIVIPKDYNMNFESISDFKWCIVHGGEIQFDWNGKGYGVFGKILNPETNEIEILIGECYCVKDGKTYNITSNEPCSMADVFYKTVDELLEHIIDGQRLNDIITEIEVTDRPFH